LEGIDDDAFFFFFFLPFLSPFTMRGRKFERSSPYLPFFLPCFFFLHFPPPPLLCCECDKYGSGLPFFFFFFFPAARYTAFFEFAGFLSFFFFFSSSSGFPPLSSGESAIGMEVVNGACPPSLFLFPLSFAFFFSPAAENGKRFLLFFPPFPFPSHFFFF